MAFFLETLFGGLMVGTLYALVAIGFVLIFKASGVFNFGQGAMVLFAALMMARFAEWIPAALGMPPGMVGNLLAIVVTLAGMVVLAWLIERLALRLFAAELAAEFALVEMLQDALGALQHLAMLNYTRPGLSPRRLVVTEEVAQASFAEHLEMSSQIDSRIADMCLTPVDYPADSTVRFDHDMPDIKIAVH